MSDGEIIEAMENGELSIAPFKKENLGPDSIDIFLGENLLVCKDVGSVLDPLEKILERLRKHAGLSGEAQRAH